MGVEAPSSPLCTWPDHCVTSCLVTPPPTCLPKHACLYACAWRTGGEKEERATPQPHSLPQGGGGRAGGRQTGQTAGLPLPGASPLPCHAHVLRPASLPSSLVACHQKRAPACHTTLPWQHATCLLYQLTLGLHSHASCALSPPAHLALGMGLIKLASMHV